MLIITKIGILPLLQASSDCWPGALTCAKETPLAKEKTGFQNFVLSHISIGSSPEGVWEVWLDSSGNLGRGCDSFTILSPIFY